MSPSHLPELTVGLPLSLFGGLVPLRAAAATSALWLPTQEPTTKYGWVLCGSTLGWLWGSGPRGSPGRRRLLTLCWLGPRLGSSCCAAGRAASWSPYVRLEIGHSILRVLPRCSLCVSKLLLLPCRTPSAFTHSLSLPPFLGPMLLVIRTERWLNDSQFCMACLLLRR